MLTFLVGAAIFHRGTVLEAARELRSLSLTAVFFIVVTVALHRFIQASLLVATVDELSIPRALVANEAYVACSNATVGGGAVGTGVKVAMLRRWGVTPEQIATSVTATSVLPAITLWFVAMLGAIWMWTNGLATKLHYLVMIVGFALSVGPLVFWSVMLRSPKMVAFIARQVMRMLQVRNHRFIARLTPKPVRVILDRIDILGEAERLRTAAIPMLGRRGLVAVLCALCNQATLSLVLIMCLRGLGALDSPVATDANGLVTRALAPITIIAVFSVARTLATFAPLPGGLGVLDAGLLSALVALGAQRPIALAAIGLFRAVTFVLPLLTGPITMALWRRSVVRNERHLVRPVHHLPARVDEVVVAVEAAFDTLGVSVPSGLGEVA